MDCVDESDVVVHCEAYIVMYLRENRVDHVIFTSKKKSVLKLNVLQNVTVIYDMRIRSEVRKNILRKI